MTPEQRFPNLDIVREPPNPPVEEILRVDTKAYQVAIVVDTIRHLCISARVGGPRITCTFEAARDLRDALTVLLEQEDE